MTAPGGSGTDRLRAANDFGEETFEWARDEKQRKPYDIYTRFLPKVNVSDFYIFFLNCTYFLFLLK